MSINYGEYETLEDAYVRRGEDSKAGDPKIRYWYRSFFGSLQVPYRFFIFEVVKNYPDSDRLAATTEDPSEGEVVADSLTGSAGAR